MKARSICNGNGSLLLTAACVAVIPSVRRPNRKGRSDTPAPATAAGGCLELQMPPVDEGPQVFSAPRPLKTIKEIESPSPVRKKANLAISGSSSKSNSSSKGAKNNIRLISKIGGFNSGTSGSSSWHKASKSAFSPASLIQTLNSNAQGPPDKEREEPTSRPVDATAPATVPTALAASAPAARASAARAAVAAATTEPGAIKDDSSVPPCPLQAALKRVWGFNGFREGQEEAVRAVMQGRDALVIMPTGASNPCRPHVI